MCVQGERETACVRWLFFLGCCQLSRGAVQRTWKHWRQRELGYICDTLGNTWLDLLCTCVQGLDDLRMERKEEEEEEEEEGREGGGG